MIYAPNADVSLWSGKFLGAIVARSVRMKQDVQVHYDENLRM